MIGESPNIKTLLWQKFAEASPHAFANDQRVAVLLVWLLSGLSSTVFKVNSYLRKCALAITFFFEKLEKNSL